MDHVSVVYPNGQKAIFDITVRLDPGQICGVVGMNGAGKSTLFKAMMGFVTPSNGTILIQGDTVQKALQKNVIAYVPQSENVDWNFPVLVEDVVMMGRYGHMGFMRNPSQRDRDIVTESLTRVGLVDFRKRQIGELSGGQKKRVFVARALAQQGQIMFLDEPFTGVDIKTEDALTSLFHKLAKEGQLIVVSTHNLGSVPNFCDTVMLINQRLLAFGPIETTYTQNNLASAFGGMLRRHHLIGSDLHDDADDRALTVLTDDERPLVMYGEVGRDKIVPAGTRKKGDTAHD
ncbi:MAG: ATP-binding cassette domain-containing protein [Pseudomonadota bacterium]